MPWGLWGWASGPQHFWLSCRDLDFGVGVLNACQKAWLCRTQDQHEGVFRQSRTCIGTIFVGSAIKTLLFFAEHAHIRFQFVCVQLIRAALLAYTVYLSAIMLQETCQKDDNDK